MIVLLRFVGSKQMHNLRFPDLSLLSTNTKLLIQGVAPVTGLSTPTWSILPISFLKLSFKWMGIWWQGVCLGWMLGSKLILYGGPGNLPIPSQTSGYCIIICSLLVTNLPTGCCFVAGVTGVWANTACCLHWAATCCDLCTDNETGLVLLGWSWALVIRLAHGGR